MKATEEKRKHGGCVWENRVGGGLSHSAVISTLPIGTSVGAGRLCTRMVANRKIHPRSHKIEPRALRAIPVCGISTKDNLMSDLITSKIKNLSCEAKIANS